ncbi:MAG TPA: hypothetical protein VFO42_02275 [Sphingomicrobium sp.]|nr:hypothetical protein [Sphingomicrobium sp.]
MRNWILAAGAAALAITVPALADPNKGQGGQKAQKGTQAKVERGGGQQVRQAKPDRAQRQATVRPDRGRDDSPRNAKSQGRGPDKPIRSAKVEGKSRPLTVDVDRDDGVRIVRRDFTGGIFPGRGLANGCPPGLDKRDNGCMPPGQVKNLLGARLADNYASAMVPFAMRNWYPDDDRYLYRSGDGFIYRVNRSNSLVDGLIPLFGGGSYYALGDPWPQPYDFYNVPNQYRSLWSDGEDYRYRYGEGAIYRLDPTTNAVNGIVALLAGDLGVGSRLPMGYDVYNVPLAYRSQYADSSDAWYRYNDGYIYQVDPKTRLITALIDAII